MKTIINELKNIELYENIWVSLKNVITGFTIAFLIALLIALMINEIRFLDKIVYPIIELLRPIPNAGWVPIAILLSSTIEQGIIFITFIGAFFPSFITIYRALKSFPSHYNNLIRLNHLKLIDKYTKIILPAIMSQIFTAMMLGISGAWMSVIMAEMISGKSGIGYYTWKNYTLLNYELVGLGVFIMGLLGALFSLIIVLVSRKIVFWTRREKDA